MILFSFFDWLIVVIPLVLILGVAMYMRRYVSSVAQFLSGGRLAGRYLVCAASGESSYAVVSAVATFEIWKAAGLSNNVWASLFAPIGIILALTGFVIFRFRETRCMTLAQFFDRRYGRKFRLFSGILIFLAGVINYGIFPGVSARFFVHYGGLPVTLNLFGLAIPTFWVVMVLLLAIVVLITVSGGQSSVMTFDCLAGLFAQCGYLIIAATLFIVMGWNRIGDVLTGGEPGYSRIDPFDNYAISDFSVWYVVMSLIISIYSYKAWQGNQGYNSAALNAHEAKMGGVLGSWRNQGHSLMYGMLAICGLVFVQHVDFGASMVQVNQELSVLDSAALRNQMEVPVALRYLLPEGIRGLLFAVMLFAYIAFDSSLLHSWASVFIQDVVQPLRKERHLPPAQHLRWLRSAVIGVAVFGFLFSVTIQISDYVYMFQQITMAVYIGGAGAVIIGGLYWSRGTTGAAWTAMILGASFAALSITAQQIWTRQHEWLSGMADPESWFGQLLAANPERFPVNGQILTLVTIGCSLASYILVSVLSKYPPCDMDKLLNRGIYSSGEMKVKDLSKKRNPLFRLLGIDEHFTKGDKIISHSVFWYNVFWSMVALVLVVSFVTGIFRLDRQGWFGFASVAYFLIPAILAGITTIWFTWGGTRDLLRYFRALKVYKPDESDDGTVTEAQRVVVHTKTEEEK